MPFFNLDDMPPAFVTPAHSTAHGCLVSGSGIEVGVFSYKAGQGAREHFHPQEQILVVLEGVARFTLNGETHEMGPRRAVVVPPMLPHRLEAVTDVTVVSSKTMIDGVGHRIG
ncbi:MAG: cupin domain-containing protein [Rhodobacteraceae bacterium]|nr:cupin domain-containing protein [Paracoccaceae bacterium]